jgi:flagellar basal-body rod protein FlgF
MHRIGRERGLGEPRVNTGRAPGALPALPGETPMENMLLVGLSRQVALERQMDVVSNNIANINTNGFKSDGPLFEEYIKSSAREGSFSDRDAAVHFVQDRGIWHDMGAGAMQQTGNPLDVAIDGEGFLTVQGPNGERYTRNGALQINSQGQLVNSEGMQVAGENGPITFQPSDRNIEISKDGRITVTEGGNTKTEGFRGKLRIVKFARPQELLKDGYSNFSAPPGVTPEPVTTARLQQGVIEKSNVNGVIEMTRMIEITRTYTQMSALLQQQGDLRKNTIQQLAEVPA